MGAIFASFVILISILGLLLTAVNVSPMKERSDKAKAAIESCEKDLKRTEHCEIVAVPSKDKGDK